jgi:hypothetical protein
VPRYTLNPLGRSHLADRGVAAFVEQALVAKGPRQRLQERRMGGTLCCGMIEGEVVRRGGSASGCSAFLTALGCCAYG